MDIECLHFARSSMAVLTATPIVFTDGLITTVRVLWVGILVHGGRERTTLDGDATRWWYCSLPFQCDTKLLLFDERRFIHLSDSY